MKTTKTRRRLCATCGGFYPRASDPDMCCGDPREDKTKWHMAEYDKDGKLVRQYEKARK